MKFAIIKTGGKQYKVAEGQKLKVEKIIQNQGDNFDFDQVLLITEDNSTKIGTPFISGAKVSSKILKHGKGEKKLVFRYKSKTRYKKTKGHRQPFTEVEITKI